MGHTSSFKCGRIIMTKCSTVINLSDGLVQCYQLSHSNENRIIVQKIFVNRCELKHSFSTFRKWNVFDCLPRPWYLVDWNLFLFPTMEIIKKKKQTIFFFILNWILRSPVKIEWNMTSKSFFIAQKRRVEMLRKRVLCQF